MGALLAHGQLGVPQDPKTLLCRAAFQLVGPQVVLVPGVIPTQVQDFKLCLVEFNEILLSSILQPVQILLNGSTTL